MTKLKHIQKLQITILLCFICLYLPNVVCAQSFNQVSLDGTWETGYHRNYTDNATVPGLVTDPGKVNTDTLWLKRKVTLPKGNWTSASLELKGARFCPSVYINGNLVFTSAGGMAPIYERMVHPALKPGKQIILEIALLSLNQMKEDDASRIPAADIWRSNVSSCLWDDVVLHVHQQSYIKSIVPQSDFAKNEALIHYELETGNAAGKRLDVSIADRFGKTILHRQFALNEAKGELALPLLYKVKAWSPEKPVLYKLTVALKDGQAICDKRELNYGFKQFKINGLQFSLNNKPVKLRAASVVWHRWVRDPEAKELAWDTTWFKNNIILRLKDLGANTLRFHLGLPPERFLDLCDRYGIMVQAEWSFFHGMKASEQSLLEQWPNWFNASLKHPCVILLHGWNETEGKTELDLAFKAINQVAKAYGPVVIGHRDVIHIHKYWWSLFENLGLYYNSYKQFPKPIMVDEFGGNYLDGNGDIGQYPTNQDSFERFLGRNSTQEERLDHQALSNGKIAEYWRRTGAAGFSPFCALSSPEDGNTWFAGHLRDGVPKPVWGSLSAAYAPVSVSLNLWDRHFTPGSKVSVQAYFFNDTEKNRIIYARLKLTNRLTGKLLSEIKLNTLVSAHNQQSKLISIVLPSEPGSWTIDLELDPKFHKTKYPVKSDWDVETINPVVPKKISSAIVGVDDNEPEVKTMLKQLHIKQTTLTDPKANILILTGRSWEQTEGVRQLIKVLENALNQGKHILLLDAGPQWLGQGYKVDLSSLQAAPKVNTALKTAVQLPFGVKANFTEAAEPESHIQYAEADSSLWRHLQKSNTWLWNGYRGGLIVPAADMELTGLNAAAYLKSWTSKGADQNLIKAGNYYSYELQGFYDFSVGANDTATQKRLRNKVRFLVDDAPALKARIDPEADIISQNLSEAYTKSIAGRVEQFGPLVSAGKALVRTPVTLLTFTAIKSKMIISQLLTNGRLAKRSEDPVGYSVRYDPVSVQLVLNMMEKLLAADEITR